MGIGSSNAYSSPRSRRRSIGRGYGSHGGKKHRRGILFRKITPRSSPRNPQHVIPIKQQYHYSYGSYPYIQPMPAYAPLSQLQPYPGYMPMYYNNNYPAPPYIFPRQPMMGPSQPVMMPQYAPYSQPTPTSRQIPVSMYPPYVSSSSPPAYFAGAPYSAPYAQAQAHPFYNNVVIPPSVSSGLASPSSSFSAPFQVATGQLSTDWTGGGKISPGFLGPPI